MLLAVAYTCDQAMISDAGHLPRLAVGLATLGLAVAVAACGSAGQTRTSSGLSGQREASGALAFARCMRSHGVPNFPDSGGRGGIRIQGSGQALTVDGISVNTPAFLAARAHCQGYLPHLPATQSQIAQQQQRGLKFARCMRSHGVPNFPDPKAAPGATGNSVVNLSGAGLNFESPAFQAAARACGGGPKGPL